MEASTSPFDMRLQRMLGHLPAVLHSRPRDVLIVGCGAGVTAGSFVVHPEVESITLCEIEPRIPPASAKFFGKENHHVMGDRRTRLVSDDARHYVLTTRDRFDIITSDPIHPWVKGAAALYSKEYFELVRARLKPGGLVTQWVPLYESDFATVKSEIATFFAVFPYAAIWGNLDVFDQAMTWCCWVRIRPFIRTWIAWTPVSPPRRGLPRRFRRSASVLRPTCWACTLRSPLTYRAGSAMRN